MAHTPYTIPRHRCQERSESLKNASKGPKNQPARGITEPRGVGLRGLGKRISSTCERLSQAGPRVKSSKGKRTWHSTPVRCRHKSSQALSPGPLRRVYWKVRVTFWVGPKRFELDEKNNPFRESSGVLTEGGVLFCGLKGIARGG